jgi:hypothetical protein
MQQTQKAKSPSQWTGLVHIGPYGAGKEARPIPWQGIALTTELFPHMDQRKTHHKDGLINLVAWGGIEPPTQGFSIAMLALSAKPSKEATVTSLRGKGRTLGKLQSHLGLGR